MLAALLVASTLATASTSSVGAEAPPVASPAPAPASAPRTLPSPDLLLATAIAPELASVALESPDLTKATEGYDKAAADYSAARDARVTLDRAFTEQRSVSRTLRIRRAAARARTVGAAGHRSELDGALRELAVDLYLDGGTEELEAALVKPDPSVSDPARRRVLGTASMDTVLAERAAFVQIEEQAGAEANDASKQLEGVRAEQVDAFTAHPAARASEVQQAAALATARSTYEGSRVLAVVVGADFPLVALDAYWRAAQQLYLDQPLCGVRWWAIAGISRVEGRHGTYGGASLDPTGATNKPIIGIALDGTRRTRVVPDSEGGWLDGDKKFDRAVGPMQFIPTTWARWQADGNEDGTSSPHNLYDAALAAAKYLCHGRTGLEADPGLRAGYFSYNHSAAYVERVLSFARSYEQAVPIPTP